MTRVTISDVARRAGVSTMTISRVVNNRGEVHPETRERILQVIEELGYRPSSVARSLITQKSQTIGLLVPDITNPFFPDIVRGAEDVAYREGYTLYVSNIDEKPERERLVMQRFEASMVDGLILCAPRQHANELYPLLQRHPHAVVINREVPLELAGSVVNDDLFGSMRAVHHLLASGRNRIGCLAGPPTSRTGQLRVQGFETALAATGQHLDRTLIETCDPNEHGGHEGLLRLLVRHPDLDGVVAFNDLVALGALQAAQEHQISVPGQLAVIGNDDIRMAALATPPLSTIRIDRYRLGQMAMEMLLEQIQGSPGRTVTLRPELVVRQSAP